MKCSVYDTYNVKSGFNTVINDTDKVITCLEGHLGKYHNMCNRIAEIRRSVRKLAIECDELELSEDMVKKLK